MYYRVISTLGVRVPAEVIYKHRTTFLIIKRREAFEQDLCTNKSEVQYRLVKMARK